MAKEERLIERQDVSGGVLLVDDVGKIQYINEHACEKFGYKMGGLPGLGLYFDEFLPKIDPETVAEGIVTSTYGLNAEGELFPLFFSMNSFRLDGELYFLYVFHDGENRARLADKMSASPNELVDYKFALDQAAIVAITDQRGKIKYVNDKFCEISKYRAGELLGEDHRIINSGYHPREFFTDLWQAITAGRVWHGEIKNRAKDGSYYWVDTTIIPFLDGDGKPYQYLAIRFEITERKRIEAELQKMTAQIIDVQEEERKRLSRELHDGLGQNLYSHLITINRLMSELDHPLLVQMQEEAMEMIEEIRDLSWELRPSVLDDLGLVPAIRSFLTRYSNHYKIAVHFDCVLGRRLAPGTETTIYRVIQEALTNVRKYAGVDEAAVTIREYEDAVRVMIEDCGRGFDISGGPRGVGLFSMDERARASGGELQIISEPGKGTKVILEVPVG
ncbi:PAS domain S-box protein [Neobacillus notoginsengisoli]|uniref:histidine kinase n=1 Tax=Neobacillus notoginsengisoli TaxID=1578198 RepID=A0A417YVV4_9BACI|nr:PAS domain-containing protein [Neobacillus notoginsengisoli]RHW41512.1 PAS domain S-box protein [Neobacillus notoginsengisoli]